MKTLFAMVIGVIIGGSIMAISKDNSYEEVLSTILADMDRSNVTNKKELTIKSKIEEIKEKEEVDNVSLDSSTEEPDIDKEAKITYQNFVKLFSKGIYDEALDIYSQELSGQYSKWYSSYVYNHIIDLMKTSSLESKNFANRMLELVPQNFHYLYLSMVSNSRLGNYKEVFYQILEIKGGYIPTKFEHSVESHFSKALEKYSLIVLKSNDIEQMRELITILEENQEKVYSKRLKNKIHHLNKVAQNKIDQENKAWQRKLELQKKQEEKERLSKLYNVQIPMTKRGRHYILDVLINDRYKYKLMLDTGATGVSVRASDIRKHDFPILRRNVRTSTANGYAFKNIFLVDSFKVGDVEITDFAVGEIRNYKDDFDDGLLGMTFLDKFTNWYIDKENHILFLNKTD